MSLPGRVSCAHAVNWLLLIDSLDTRFPPVRRDTPPSVALLQALYFLCYGTLKDMLAMPLLRGPAWRPTVAEDLAIAFVAGAINATMTCPIWVAATRLKLRRKKTSAAKTNDDATKAANGRRNGSGHLGASPAPRCSDARRQPARRRTGIFAAL